jgi:hypothetical protein
MLENDAPEVSENIVVARKPIDNFGHFAAFGKTRVSLLPKPVIVFL